MSELTQSERESILTFAPDAPYIFVCRNCKTSQWKQQDCETTKSVRNGSATCADCDTQLTMVRDAKQ